MGSSAAMKPRRLSRSKGVSGKLLPCSTTVTCRLPACQARTLKQEVGMVRTGHVHLHARTCSMRRDHCCRDHDGGIAHMTMGATYLTSTMERSHNTVRAEYKAHAGIQLRLPVLHCFVHSVCLVMLSEEVIAHNLEAQSLAVSAHRGRRHTL